MDSDWYKDGVFYNIDVRLFYDGDGDGIGDLEGLMKKLDYLQELGVTAILLESSALLEAPASTLGVGTSDALPEGAKNVSAFKELLRDTHDRRSCQWAHVLADGQRLAPYGFYWLMLNRRVARVSSTRVVDVGARTNGTDAMETPAIPA